MDTTEIILGTAAFTFGGIALVISLLGYKHSVAANELQVKHDDEIKQLTENIYNVELRRDKVSYLREELNISRRTFEVLIKTQDNFLESETVLELHRVGRCGSRLLERWRLIARRSRLPKLAEQRDARRSSAWPTSLSTTTMR